MSQQHLHHTPAKAKNADLWKLVWRGWIWLSTWQYYSLCFSLHSSCALLPLPLCFNSHGGWLLLTLCHHDSFVLCLALLLLALNVMTLWLQLLWPLPKNSYNLDLIVDWLLVTLLSLKDGTSCKLDFDLRQLKPLSNLSLLKLHMGIFARRLSWLQMTYEAHHLSWVG